jgi:segregation and condensation protein B
MRYRSPFAERTPSAGLIRTKRPIHSSVAVAETRPTGGCKRPDNRVARLEAMLFLSRHPQTSRKLAELAGLADGTKARTLVRTLNRRYDAHGSAFRVEEVAGGFQLMTRAKFASWLRRLYPAAPEIRLSPPALETLAVVAYRQPVLRAEIEAIRGVQSGEVLRQLIERDLVRIAGRSEELGRPFLYGTTRQFLQVFGLRHLDELPRADVLRSREPMPTLGDIQNRSDSDILNQSTTSQVAAEEENVKTLTTKTRPGVAPEPVTATTRPRRNDPPPGQVVLGPREREEDEDLEEDESEEENLDEEEDFEDEDIDDDEDDDEDEDDDDLEDEPWEEVDDEDEDLDEDEDEDEDWDEDDDWEDEDWDEDDDWDEDEDEDEEEEAEDEGE